MNSTIDASSKHAFHTIANAEFTGVYDNLIYNFAHTSGSISSYHFFIRYEDKVYVEVKGIGEIVLPFAELQKKRYCPVIPFIIRKMTDIFVIII